MENITVVGIKEINQKIAKMERSLEDISKSLELIAKIMNRQIPKPVKLVTGFDPINGMDIHLEEVEDDDE
jgi:hypothetical protein